MRKDIKTHTIKYAYAMDESIVSLLIHEPGLHEPKWVPKSVISRLSDVRKKGDSGNMVIKLWWAKKENMV